MIPRVWPRQRGSLSIRAGSIQCLLPYPGFSTKSKMGKGGNQDLKIREPNHWKGSPEAK